MGALVVALLVAAAVASASLAHSHGPGSTDRASATRLALKALGVGTRHGAEIVFTLPSPIAAGSDVRSAGPGDPAGSGAAVRTAAPLVAHARGAAWFFYDDLSPFQNYEHPGRVVLVDVRSGAVTVSSTLSWAPTIDGALPAFLASPDAYDSGRYHVFYRPYTGGSHMIPGPLAPAAEVAAGRPRAALDPPQAARAADALAAEHSCTVRVSDTLPGGYYGFGKYAQSRAGLYYRLGQLGELNPGFRSAIYSPDGGLSPTAFVSRQIAADGCRDMLLYMIGGGYAGQTAVNVGMEVDGGKVRHQDLTLAALRGLISGHPHTTFELVIDAPHAAGFHALGNESNVRLIATPATPGGGSFTYVPNARVGGRLVANDTNPLKLLQFTNRLLYGFNATIATPCEVTQAVADGSASGTALAYLIARGFAHGGPVDFPTRAGFGSPGNVQALRFSAAPPQCAPAHQPPVLAGIETSTLSVDAGQPAAAVTSTISVSDPDSATLVGATVSISAGLVASEDVLGFTNQNGITGSYAAATGVLTLTGHASLAQYQDALRAVTYRDSNGTSPTTGNRAVSFQVNDGAASQNLSNTVSRTVTVAPNQPPVAHDDSATTGKSAATDINVLGNDTDPEGEALHVASVDTTGTKGSVSINPDGTIHYDPNGQFNALNDGQTATDTFTYKASDGFADSNAATVTVTITGSNAAPVLSGIETSPISYEAGSAAVAVTGSLTVSDIDDTTLAGATVRIASGFASGEDALVFTNQNGITGSYDAATGVLALAGTASLADYQAALRSVTYADSNATSPSTVTRTISFQVDDGHVTNHASNVVSRDIAVIPPPVLSGIESSAIVYHAGTAAVPVTSTLAISASTTLVSATVAVTAGFTSAEDSLSFTNQNGITGSYSASTGVLTLSGSATVADYQSALRSVTYANSNGANPSTATRTISFTVNDGTLSSNTVSRDVSVLANQAPTANADTATTNEKTAIDIPVLANDTDPQGYPLSVATVDTTGTKGSVSVNPDGTIHYDPNGQFNALNEGQTATDTFTYTATDGFHDSNSATVTVTITGVNDAPVLSGIETNPQNVAAGETTLITSTLAVSDVDDANLAGATVSITSGLAAAEDTLSFTNQNGITGSYNVSTGVLTLTGSATLANYQAALRSVTYRDVNGVNPTTGTRTVAFQVDDGHAANNLSNVATRDVVVGPNLPPTASPVSATTGEKTATDINVLSSVTDPEGDPVSVASVDTTGTKGLVSINPNGTIHYDPNGQFNTLNEGQTATDTFTYTASDGFHDSNSATVTVTITGVNDAPVLANIESSALSYRAQDPPVAITSTLTVSDVDNTTLAGATVGITSGFESANDTLAFTNQNGITGSYDGSTGVLTLTGTASLADYQTALRSVVFSSSDGGPSPGSRTIAFQVNDGQSANQLSNVASRTINLTPANQPPVAGTNDFTNVVGNTTFAKGTSPTGPAAKVSGSLLDNASDPDSPHAALTVTGSSSPSHGTVTINLDGTFTYLPAAGYIGPDSFTYTISDNDPTNPKTTTGTVNLTVGPLVWYVDDSLGAAGDGRSSSPFNSLAAANAAVGSGDTVFLYQGSGDYTGGTAMKSNEKLLGQPNGLTVNGFGLVAAGGANPKITNSAGDGIDLASGADVEAVDVHGASGNGIAAASVGAATVGGNGIDTAVTGSGGDGIHVSGGSGAMPLHADVSGSTAHSVSISGRTGGTVTLPGTISDAGTGISLASNAGATIAFSGKLTAGTGANTALSATGGGTVSATGSGSTLATTTATALTVQNTSIGASGLTFQSVSAGTSTSGPSQGIALSSTGTSGGLTVTGTGSPGSGGTIEKTTATGAAGSGAGNGGVYLNNAGAASLTDMNVSGNHSSGIYGNNLPGLALAGDSITGNGTSLSNDDDGVRMDGLTGTASITNTSITGSANNNARIASGTGANLGLTVTGSTFGPKTAATANDGLEVLSNEPSGRTLTVTATGDAFTGNYADGVAVLANTPGTLSATIGSDTVTGNTGAGINLASGGSVADPATFSITNNTLTGQQGNAINVGNFGSAAWTGHITGNTIGSAGTADSGSTGGSGISVVQETTGSLAADVSHNTVRQIENEYGIVGSADTGTGTLNLTLNADTVNTDQTTSLDGIFVNSGVNDSDTSTVCMNATSNNATTAGTAAGNGQYDPSGLTVDQNTPSTVFKIQGFSGNGADPSAVASYLESTNTLSGAGGGAQAFPITGFTSGSCATAPAADLAGRARILSAAASPVVATHQVSRRRTSGRTTGRAGHRSAKVVHHKTKVHGGHATRRLTAGQLRRLRARLKTVDQLARGGHADRGRSR